MKKNKKYVVYTALFGHYEELNEFEVSNKADIDFVCFTDNPNLTSETWKLVHVESFGLDPHRESRRVKLLPHQFLAEYEFSLYIDNSVTLLVDPIDIFSTYLEDSKQSLACLRHPYRNCIYDEAEAVIMFNLEDEIRVREQMEFYKNLGYPKNSGLIAGTILLRKHNDPDLIRAMESWFYHVLRFSKRDQLSFNFVAWKLEFAYQEIDLDLDDNSLFVWDSAHIRRIPPDFNDLDYLWLNPDVQKHGVNPKQHYLEYGFKEKRSYRYFSPLELDQLANRYKSDKGSLYYNRHFYSRIYDHYFKPLRNENITFLEIGLLRHDVQAVYNRKRFADAPSLLMWRDYFSSALIYGFDIADFSLFRADRCKVIRGDQGNRRNLARLRRRMKKSPTVILDDGSHASHHQQISLGALFEFLRPGGLYFIEDLLYQPPQWEPDNAMKTIDMLKMYQRTGKINSPYMKTSETQYLEENIETIQFYDSMDYQGPGLGKDSLVMIKKREESE